MPHSSRASQDSFQHNSIKALAPAVYSLTILFGSQLLSLGTLLAKLTIKLCFLIIPKVQSYLRISSRKWRFQESAWSNDQLILILACPEIRAILYSHIGKMWPRYPNCRIN